MSADFLNPILEWLNAHPQSAGIVTFIISAAESVAIIGTIVPGSIMMTALGALAGAGVIPLWSTILWAILGAIVGDSISYSIGYHYKNRLYSIWPFKNNPHWLENGKSFFHRHGSMSVFIGRFVGPVRALVPLVAGMLDMKPLQFYIANITSAIGWAPTYMLPGILLGAASLELPPDIAVHFILMLLLMALLVLLVFWIAYRFFSAITHQIDHLLNWLWQRLQTYRYFNLITKALKHHNAAKTHGQLKLAFYFLLVSVAFLGLAFYIKWVGAETIAANQAIYAFLASLRNSTLDTIAIYITLLGQKEIILSTAFLFSLWLFWRRQFYTASHIFIVIILAIGSVYFLKNWTHSPRPWGIETKANLEIFSFPSGHATLSTVIYVGLALLLTKYCAKKYHRFLYYTAGIIVGAVCITRLYLGAHWFTDILGGWLLGAILLMVITLSYHRSVEKTAGSFTQLCGVFLILLVTIYFLFSEHQLPKLKNEYALPPVVTHSITEEAWQKQEKPYFPQYRINRFGMRSEMFNVQWLENIDTIKTMLIKNGWYPPPERDWITVLYRISGVQNSSDYLPLVSAIHLNKTPVLVLMKEDRAMKKTLVLRLWHSNLLIGQKGELWVGTVDFIPRTYSWLFKKTAYPFQLNTPAALIKITPPDYQIKDYRTALPPRKKNSTVIQYRAIILLQPR